MNKLAFNGERRRPKPQMRQSWAKALIRPQTVKALIKFGQWITPVVKLFIILIGVFRD